MDLAAKRAALEKHGYTIGDRDPRLNTNYKGDFMVVEPFTEDMLPTKDGSNGPFCVVGDELELLVEAGYAHLIFMELEND